MTMFCWGSWGNTQKLSRPGVGATSFFYWDLCDRYGVFSLLIGFTLGSFGGEGAQFRDRSGAGRPEAYRQRALLGGAVFKCRQYPALRIGVAGRSGRGFPARRGAGPRAAA